MVARGASRQATVIGEVRWGLAAFSLVWGSALAVLVAGSVFVILGYSALLLFEDTGWLRRETIIGLAGVVALLSGGLACLPGLMQWAGGYRVVFDSRQLVVQHVFGEHTFELSRLDWLAEYAESNREHGVALSHDGDVFVIPDACLTPDAQFRMRVELHRLCMARGLPFEAFDYVPRSSSLHPLRAFHAGAFDLFGSPPDPACEVVARPSLTP